MKDHAVFTMQNTGELYLQCENTLSIYAFFSLKNASENRMQHISRVKSSSPFCSGHCNTGNTYSFSKLIFLFSSCRRGGIGKRCELFFAKCDGLRIPTTIPTILAIYTGINNQNTYNTSFKSPRNVHFEFYNDFEIRTFFECDRSEKVRKVMYSVVGILSPSHFAKKYQTSQRHQHASYYPEKKTL